MVFDLDGVVTDPTADTNEVSKDVLDAIAADLKSGTPVSFNTGRAFKWVDDEILVHLQSLSPAELENLLVVSEKGSLVVEFNNGKPVLEIAKSLSLPKPFANDVKALLKKDQGSWKLSDFMFWDEDKMTMGSIEKLRDKPIPLDEFHEKRDVLLKELEKLMQKHKLSDFKIDATIIATDLEHKTAGKHKGAEQVINWLKRKRITPEEFITFGDSPSDAEMARVFSESAPTKFIYVGKNEEFDPPKDAKYKTIKKSASFSADTLEHLLRLKD